MDDRITLSHDEEAMARRWYAAAVAKDHDTFRAISRQSRDTFGERRHQRIKYALACALERGDSV